MARLLSLRGLSRRAATCLVTAGERVRVLAAQTGCEHAATLDAITGAPLGEVLIGTATDVDLVPHLIAFEPDRRYVSVHAHPNSSPPSPYDMLVIVTTSALDVVAVVGVDGTWYVLSRDPSRPLADETAARQVFARAFLALRPHYLARVQAGELSRQEALAALLDAVWRRIALPLGLRYDRTHQEADDGDGR